MIYLCLEDYPAGSQRKSVVRTEQLEFHESQCLPLNLQTLLDNCK